MRKTPKLLIATYLPITVLLIVLWNREVSTWDIIGKLILFILTLGWIFWTLPRGITSSYLNKMLKDEVKSLFFIIIAFFIAEDIYYAKDPEITKILGSAIVGILFALLLIAGFTLVGALIEGFFDKFKRSLDFYKKCYQSLIDFHR